MTEARQRAAAALGALGAAERRLLLRSLPEAELRMLEADWPSWAHPGQLAEGEARIWVLLAGRGFGKTRAGAEWVSAFARAHPDAAVALVGATADEARRVMIEGRSGLLAVARAEERERMLWEPSRRRLVFASGAEAFLYSAANPESLRGPEHHIAWCDELAKWRRGQAAWDNLMLGLRLDAAGAEAGPRVLVTTTPRPVPVLKALLRGAGTMQTGGGTRGNPHLPDAFVESAEAAHKGTRFGRQELEGVLLDDVEGALWTRETIERARVHGARLEPGRCAEGDRPHPNPSPEGEGLYGGASPEGEGLYRRVVVGVDPPASAAGTCGIVVCATGADGIAYVLADCSAGGLSPEGWAARVARAAEAWGAHRVVAERNNGGTMVEAVLRGAEAGLPVTLVHAAAGKAARAEPVAILFETGKARFAGAFPELEDELAGFTAQSWQGAGASPDRADAMIWAMTELAVKPARAEPRVRRL